jgi:hypothetical protein
MRVVHAVAAVVLKGGEGSQRLMTGTARHMPVGGKMMIKKKSFA